jgi:gluconolactonase
MKRILPWLSLLALGAFACSSSHNNSKATPAGDGGSGTDNTGNTTGDTTDGDGGTINATNEEINTDPTKVDPATVVLETDAYTDGPVWHTGMGVLFFTTPLGNGALYRMLPDGRVLKVRDGDSDAGTQPIGNALNPAGDVITVEAHAITTGKAADVNVAPKIIATTYSGEDAKPADPLNPNAPQPDAGTGGFDTLKHVIARKDGTMYVTDPGYFAQPIANRIYRVTPQGKVTVVDAFEDVPRPNGLALSPDEKSLYVGFSSPLEGTLPYIRKYAVEDNGTLGEYGKFTDVVPAGVAPADTGLDGITVDKVGNLYAAAKGGILVYKPDGSVWGAIAVPEQPTGVAFGGADMKTLYVTTQGAKIWQISAKIAGITGK